MRKRFLTLAFLLSVISLQSQTLTIPEMEQFLRQHCSYFEKGTEAWNVYYDQQLLFVLFDETTERLRIFTPVINTNDLENGQLETMMEANFKSSLDARYALYEGFVVALYTHPTKEITARHLQKGLQQVTRLHNTFGTTYTSGERELPRRERRENKKVIDRERVTRS